MTVDIPKILPSKVAVLPHHGNNNHTNPAASHPNYVKIVEVGPRDGLQNEKTIVPTPTKISLINKLSSTGLRVIEAGAFVSPKWVPQMSDTPQILVHLDKHPTPAVAAAGADGIMYPYLVPNIQGLRRALELGTTNLKEIAIFASASEGFSQRNINCSIAESLVRFRHVLDLAKEKGIRVRGYISMVISCPYDGPTPPAVVADVTQKLLDMGCYEISLGDTNGSGTPATVSALLTTLTSKPYLIPVNKLACHFHDTYNQALVNSMAALYHGIRVFDSSVAGLGGCPYSKGATGNVSTEDLVYFLEGIGFHTGVDLERVSEVGEWISNELGRKNGSKVGPALLTRRRAELEKEKEKERAHHEAEIKL
ncbi:putative 3-hydroxymethyl-3-methylglutaryl-CoA lyase 2-like protein [Kalaharituber pfeilii]|nr:putative 3-hydroxymethyl-3-methylglutaryl-CoA lyase 2-like protein [Kalaharituber pfeilii]